MHNPNPLPPIKIITDLETLHALSVPIRVSILNEIGRANDRGEYRTVRQLAEALETSTHRLYYHIRQLEKHDLIRVGGTRLVSGILEKQYAVTAQRIEVAPDIFSAQRETETELAPDVRLFDSAVQTARRDLAKPLDPATRGWLQGRDRHIHVESVLLDRQLARAFHTRLLDLVRSFSAAGRKGRTSGAIPFTLLTVLTPANEEDVPSP